MHNVQHISFHLFSFIILLAETIPQRMKKKLQLLFFFIHFFFDIYFFPFPHFLFSTHFILFIFPHFPPHTHNTHVCDTAFLPLYKLSQVNALTYVPRQTNTHHNQKKFNKNDDFIFIYACVCVCVTLVALPWRYENIPKIFARVGVGCCVFW